MVLLGSFLIGGSGDRKGGKEREREEDEFPPCHAGARGWCACIQPCSAAERLFPDGLRSSELVEAHGKQPAGIRAVGPQHRLRARPGT